MALPPGFVLEDSKQSGLPPGFILESDPAAKKRTLGEAAADVGASLTSGAGALLQFPGQVVGLVPGLRGVGEALAAPGKAVQEFGEGLKSQGLRVREALRSQAMSEAEKNGMLAEFATAIKSTITDPALLVSFVAEQLPQLIGPGGAAKVTTMLGKGVVETAAAGAAREAAVKALGAKATSAAVGTGAVMQGADIGQDTYEAVKKAALAQGMSEQEAEDIANQKARVAAAEAAVISLATTRGLGKLGGAAIEKRLAGVAGEGRIKSLLGEATQEALEEGGGKFASNVGVAEVDPDFNPRRGVGSAAGLGAIGGGTLGAILGGQPNTPETATKPREAGETPIEVARREAEAKAAEKAAAKAAAKAPPAEIPPLPETIDELFLYDAQLKQMPKSAERDAAIKAAKNKHLELLAQDIEAGRASAETVKQFMTAEEAATATITPREELGAEPVQPEAPAEPETTAEPEAPAEPEVPVKEPKVRKVGEPAPLPDVLDSATIKTIGFTRGKIHDALVGKSVADPEIRTVLEEYKQRTGANEKTVAKIDAFLARLPEPVAVEAPAAPEVAQAAAVPAAPEVAQAAAVPAAPEVAQAAAVPAAPEVAQASEVPRVESTQIEPAAGGAGVSVAGEPSAGATTEGTGVSEPVRVVSPVADAGQPAGGEGQPSVAVAEGELVTRDYVRRALSSIKDYYKIEGVEELDNAMRRGQMPNTEKGMLGWVRQGNIQGDLVRIKDNVNKLNALAFNFPEAFAAGVSRLAEFGVSVNERDPVNDVIHQMSLATQTPQDVFTNGLKARVPDSATQVSEAIGVTPPAPAVTPPAAPNVPKGSVENRVKALNVNAAVGGVPDLKVIRETLEPIDPKMAQAVAYYLGVDSQGGLLVGANNLPQTPSAQEAGQMAGLGENSGDRVKKVAKALGITAPVIRKFQASQNAAFSEGRSKTASESGTGARAEPQESGALTGESWYEPIAKKGLRGANHTELARAVLLSQRYLGTTKENESVAMGLMNEAQARAKRPEFAAAFRKQQELLSPDQTGISRGKSDEAALLAEPEYEEDIAPGQEEAVEEDKPGREEGDEPTYRTIPQSPVVTNRASHAELEKVVSDIEKTLGGKVAVTILDDVTDVDSKQKPGSRAGATIKGGIYLFRSGIAEGIEGQKTIFHELFHKGLKNLLPEAEYRAMMNKFYSQSAEIRAMADAYLASDVGKADTKDLSPQDARVLAVEESLAEVAEETKLKPTMIRQIGNFLARAADQLGMPRLARAIRTMGLNEQEKFIHDALQAGLGVGKAGEGASRFRTRKQAPVEDETQAPRVTEAIGEQESTGVLRRMLDTAKNPKKLRTALTDSLAGLEDIFTKAYGGNVRDNAGNLNPIVLLSRALDALRVSEAVQHTGGLFKRGGLWTAGELTAEDGRQISYEGVLRQIANAAKRADKTYEAYRKEIDEILYGHREFNLRERNQAEGAEKQVTLLLDDAEIDRREQAFQDSEFIKGLSADLDLIRFNGLDAMVESGRLTEEQAQVYKDAVGYIPFNRIGEYENAYNSTKGINRGVAASKKMRELEGSDRRQSTSVIENFSGLIDWMTKETMKTDAASRAMEDLVALGLARRGNAPAKDAPGGEIKVYKDGKEKVYYVSDPSLVVGFTQMDRVVSDVTKALGLGTRILRAGVTAMPGFAFKQVFEDITRAYAFAGVKDNVALVGQVLRNFPKNWWNEIFKQKSTSVRELERLGVIGTFDITKQSNLKNVLQSSGAQKESLGHAVMRVAEAAAKASDLAVRQAIFEQVKKETGDVVQAESAAREIINFSRRGTSETMSTLSTLIPFFHAYTRGMDKLAQAAAGKKVGMSIGTARSQFRNRMMVLMGMGFAYALMMQDDDDYQALPDHIRDTNWVLPGSKELGFTPAIPIPADLGFLFKAIPERIVRYVKYQGTEEEQGMVEVLGELAKRGIDVFATPNISAPQVLRPFVENIINYSWYLGRPLESSAQLKLDPSQRYGVGTSDTMKAVSLLTKDAADAVGIPALEVSPIKLENAVRGLFGTAAGVGLSVFDAVVNPDRTDRPMHQQLAAQATGASSVMKSPVGTRYMDVIYNLADRVEAAHSTVLDLQKRDPEAVEAYIESRKGLLAIRGEVNAVMNQIRSLNKQAGMIDRDTTIPSDERRKLVDELRAEQNDIAHEVYRLRKTAMDIQLGKE